MEINKEFTRQRYVALEGQSASEYTLPDYQGDVKKILFSSAEAEDSGRYQSGDTLECVGTVVYKIVYMDSEGRITPVTFTGDYEMTARCEGERYIDSYNRTRVANFNLRLMGPRRFSVKSALASDLMICERCEYTVAGSEGLELESSLVSVEQSTAQYLRSAERELAEEIINFEGAIADEVEVVLHSADVVGVSLTKSDDGVAVRCQIMVRALIACEGGVPQLEECCIDFQESIEGVNLGDGVSFIPSVAVISESIGVNPHEGGVSVTANIIAEATAVIIENSSVKLLGDCFSTEREVISERGEFAYTEHLGTRLVSERLAFSVGRDSIGAENVRNVLYESATVKIEEQAAAEGSVKIKGSVHVSAIACEVSEEGAPSYAPLRFEHPFEINVNIGCQIPEKVRILSHLSSDCANIDLDGDSVNFSCNLCGAVSAYAERREPCITSVALGEDTYFRESSLVSVYYPDANESLFEVAKRFHVAPIKLARDNELTEAVFAAVGSPLSTVGIRCLIVK